MNGREPASDAAGRVSTRREGHVLVVSMQREPKRNAVNRALADAIDEALNTLDDDTDLWAGVLTGTSTVFSAGSDLSAAGDNKTVRVASTGSSSDSAASR